jgi:hypothetical protein
VFSTSFSQGNKVKSTDNKIYTSAELDENAGYLDGTELLYANIYHNYKNPEALKKNKITICFVAISFIIEKNGKISDLNGINNRKPQIEPIKLINNDTNIKIPPPAGLIVYLTQSQLNELNRIKTKLEEYKNLDKIVVYKKVETGFAREKQQILPDMVRINTDTHTPRIIIIDTRKIEGALIAYDMKSR